MIHTSIHELGHVFNLQHDQAQSSFMGDNTLHRGFTAGDCGHLRAAAQRHPDYAPGGSNFAQFEFGTLPGSGARIADNLELTAQVERKSFLLGEPVALNLELAVVGKKAVVVPDELDPGFETLRIWYENPLGERLLYRSRNVLCRTGSRRVTLSPGMTLENNPRISLGRKGPTMRHPGEYRVWAEFGGTKGRLSRIVRSPVVSFEVRAPRSDEEIEISAALRLPGMAACIVDKSGRLRSRERRLLQNLVHRYPKHPALQHARYALAHHHVRSRRPALAADLLHGISLPRGLAARGARRLAGQLHR
jgi:hypothetical protein